MSDENTGPVVTYVAEPTLIRFHQDRYNYQVRIVRGVPGSGKSVGCMEEIMYCAMEQPANRQGVRKTRFLIVRQTYPRLQSTTIKTWLEWFKEPMWSFRNTVPITAWGKFPLPDGTRVECEVLFMSFETERDLDAMKSLELTGTYVNEVHESSLALINTALERATRYPRKDDGGGHFGHMVWCDSNTPTQGHWLEKLELDTPAGWKYYIQPAPLIAQYSADKRVITGWELNPLAENIQNLPSGANYYLSRVGSMTKRQLDQGILNKYGTLYAGKAVFEEFWNPDTHILPQHTQPSSTAMTYVGIDTTGLNPAAIFCQLVQGCVIVAKELVARDTPFEVFLSDYMTPFIAEHFPDNTLLVITDPANPRDSALGITPNQRLTKAGYRTQSAKTNKWLTRREAVTHFLNKRKGLYIDPSCQKLIQGFNGRYVYKELVVDGMHSETPLKNEFADPQDALQYVLMHLTKGAAAEIQPGAMTAWRKNRPKNPQLA